MSEESDIGQAIAAGEQQASIEKRYTSFGVGEREIPVVLVPEGFNLQVPHEALKRALKLEKAPLRLAGQAKHQELDSFIAHLNRFKDSSSVVWADPAGVALMAVLNYHEGPVGPRWCDHRSTYACPLSRQWQLWMGAAGASFNQDQFADLLEENAADLASPEDGDQSGAVAPARLMDVARSLRVHSKSTFERSVNVTTGESSLVAKVENSETSTRVPTAFMLGIPVFEAGEGYRLEARLRLRMENGRPLFSFVIPAALAAKTLAFNEVRDRVAKETGLPVYAGTPESVTVE